MPTEIVSCSPDTCQLYWCPTASEIECPEHGGFDICCSRPDLHKRIMPGQKRVVSGYEVLGKTVTKEEWLHVLKLHDMEPYILGFSLNCGCSGNALYTELQLEGGA